jgi:DNA-binding transcriptional ArsR family regulator
VKELLAVTKALSDENRVRIVAALGGGELCVCQLIELLELAPSTVSKHLAQLRQAGLLDVRKDGRWAYYRLAGRSAPSVVRRALALVRDTLADDPRAANDAARLERILRVAPEVLCGQQREQPERRRPAAATTRGAR